jgi:hypothetical protein
MSANQWAMRCFEHWLDPGRAVWRDAGLLKTEAAEPAKQNAPASWDFLDGVAGEHYEVARSLGSEHPGRTFTTAEFKQRYGEKYPNRNATSILPASYSVPSAPTDVSRPKFLERSNRGYVFTRLTK